MRPPFTASYSPGRRPCQHPVRYGPGRCPNAHRVLLRRLSGAILISMFRAPRTRSVAGECGGGGGSWFVVSSTIGRRTWTLATLREKLIKIGAKVVHDAKAATFQLAEVAVPRALFAAILGRIGRLRAALSPG